jgi:hemerythrin-like domain-containing protein
MTLPRDSFQADLKSQITEGWRDFIHSMEESLNMLEKDIDEAAEMSEKCTGEWCEATEHVIDELSNSLFSISEPRWSSEEDSKKLKALKRRVHDLYAKYKAIVT